MFLAFTLFFSSSRCLPTAGDKGSVLGRSATVAWGSLVLGVLPLCLGGRGTGLLPDPTCLIGLLHEAKGLLVTMTTVVCGLHRMIILWKKYTIVAAQLHKKVQLCPMDF